MKLQFIQSKNIHDYRPLLGTLREDFGSLFHTAMLMWCGLIDDPEDVYWQIWLIRQGTKTVGVCGLYSMYEGRKDELWLGWLGVQPKLRGQGIGSEALRFLEKKATSVGCKVLKSYVDEKGKPLPFYYRNGFTRVGTVREYLGTHPELTENHFESLADHVIRKPILSPRDMARLVLAKFGPAQWFRGVRAEGSDKKPYIALYVMNQKSVKTALAEHSAWFKNFSKDYLPIKVKRISKGQT